MRISIIRDGCVVSIDGESYGNVDLGGLAETIHAVQWYGERGEIEHKDPVTHKMIANEEISDFEQFAFVVPAWSARKSQIQSEIAAFKSAMQAAQ
jgi:hypothetical protein